MRRRSESARPIPLFQIPDARGTLTVLEELVHTPFAFDGVRWFRGVNGRPPWTTDAIRGEALVMALEGEIDVVVDPVGSPRRARLGSPATGLYLPPDTSWSVEAETADAIGFVVAPARMDDASCAIPAYDARVTGFGSTTVDDCRVAILTVEHRPHLDTIEVVPCVNTPYRIRRLYVIHDVPRGAARGGHAHRTLEQMLVAVSGSFEVVLDDGRRRQSIVLGESNPMVYVAPGIWRVLRRFSAGAICLTLASHPYEEDDYIRDFEDFTRMKLAALE